MTSHIVPSAMPECRGHDHCQVWPFKSETKQNKTDEVILKYSVGAGEIVHGLK